MGNTSENFYGIGLGSISFDYNSSTTRPFAIFIQQDINPSDAGAGELLNETFDQMIARFRVNDQYIYQQKDISADGVQGVELFYKSAVSGQPYHIEAYFPLQKGSYISLGADYQSVPQSIFDAIISTLKWDTATVIKQDSATGMAVYNNNGIRFEYPIKFNTDYASLTVQTTVQKVDNSKLDSNGCYPGQVSERTGNPVSASVLMLDDIKFCYSTGGDVGAGQLYTNYSYTTLHNGNVYTLVYSVHTSNGCGAYTNQKDECLAAQKNFDTLVVKPIQQSISSFTFIN